MCRRQILFVGFVVRVEDTKLPKCVMFGELVGAAGCVRAQGKSEWGVSWTTSELRYQHRPVDNCSPGRGGMTQEGGTRGGTFHDEIDCWRKSELDYGMQLYTRT